MFVCVCVRAFLIFLTALSSNIRTAWIFMIPKNVPYIYGETGGTDLQVIGLGHPELVTPTHNPRRVWYVLWSPGDCRLECGPLTVAEGTYSTAAGRSSLLLLGVVVLS